MKTLLFLPLLVCCGCGTHDDWLAQKDKERRDYVASLPDTMELPLKVRSGETIAELVRANYPGYMPINLKPMGVTSNFMEGTALCYTVTIARVKL